ncbi:Glycine cleavage system transcriptional activator [Roseovarius albus]|uniref:Glycine cleavage system transcriptional activator n=1 Tax=Roseovarius albus TaxID=1247867 RepID=A0A1X6Z9V3_9RHOB|nr:LysR substrate-binding domain-containing protein [Roseovarius albus]SLN45463.1 Glycine cleavage system transcriptional activator [Roseovarius albus]
MTNIRHLRALQAFDETAKHLNLSKAAEALNVTHGAVSRQIKLLEEYLGTALFRRRPAGVELTSVGAQLFQSTRQAFPALQKGVSEVKRQPERQSLKVSLPNAVALKWLVPRLPLFQQKHPGIALFLETDDGITDFDTSEVDIALRFGVPNWNGLYSEKITDEELVAVASPDLVGDVQLPMSATDIAQLPLLYDVFNAGWDKWAEKSGLNPDQVTSQNIQYFDSAVLLEAAIDRQGVALARHLLAARDLENGRLVRLDKRCIPLERGLHFVCRLGDQDRVAVRILKKWLLSICV